jgi:hypothetical protein
LQSQTLEYRKAFGLDFVAYDPGTIDEMPIVSRHFNASTAETIKVTHADSWPQVCDPAGRLAGCDVLADKNEIELNAGQIRELRAPIISDHRQFQTSLERQVRSRDFRLIEQSKGLIAYRPTLGGRWSGAVRDEIDHVYRHQKKPFYVIKGLHDGKLDEGSKCWGEFDLSTPEKRQQAFALAKDELLKSIADSDRE